MGKGREIAGFFVWVVVVFAAVSIGSFYTSRGLAGWYDHLAKPSFTPPDWVFGPVWTVLYLMMAAAAWLVWRSAPLKNVTGPLALFAVQLALNVAWTAIFFGLMDPGRAFAEIVILWLAIAATAVLFWQHSRTAALLLVPYWLWVTFASVLNFAIWRMNR